MRKYIWIAAAVVVVVIGYGLVRSGMQNLGARFVGQGTEMLLGLRVGDRVPQEGRTITSIAVPGSSDTITPDAPIGLYPAAVVQGVTILQSVQGSMLQILLGTDDPEESVLQAYAAVWSGLAVGRAKPRPSILYGSAAPNATEQSLIVKTGRDYMPSVSVQRGPVIKPMQAAEFTAVLLGRTPLPLESGGATMTEIYLYIPLR
jgi:hypothetical protein